MAIRGICTAAKLDKCAADKFVASKKTVEKVRQLVFADLFERQGPEIEIQQSVHAQQFSDQIRFEIAEARRIGEAYHVVSSSKLRNRVVRAVKRGPRNVDDVILLIQMKGIYPLVHRDQLANGTMPRDMNDYLRSLSWLGKFNKGARGGRPRQVPAEWLAVRLAWWFQQFIGRPCWESITEIVAAAFPSALFGPGKITKSKKNINYRRRRFAKELVRRYCRWAQAFRPTIGASEKGV
ncbi:MAG: hypothetical protein U1E51_28040 [Candidatus Binatia bacterium]|nr:hypothetical protein [Candidatus Binatia bacterium]